MEKEKDLLKKINLLIENEEFEDAKVLLNIYIPDDNDPFKRNLLRQMDDIIQHSDVEDEKFIEDYNFFMFGGTDPQPYHLLDKKLLHGLTSIDEIKDLYDFWSAYPKHRTYSYCLKMFKWIVENNGICHSDLATYIIDKIKIPSASCFYFVLARERGFFREVKNIARNYHDFFGPKLLAAAQIEYIAYLESKNLPYEFSLENISIFERE